MLQVCLRFFFLNPITVNPEVYFILGGVWLFLVLLTWSSIVKSVGGRLGKIVWCLVTLLLPVIGIVAYCFRCLASTDLTPLKEFGLLGRADLNRGK